MSKTTKLAGAAKPIINLVHAWLDDVRRNHGLEHATVAVLFARKGPQRLAGRASGNGFFIVGNVDPTLLRSCADEALLRMQKGERGLAVSPLCGTNLAVTGAVCAAFSMASLARNRDKSSRQRLGDAISAATLGAVVSQPLGRLVQEHITTRADLGDIEITAVRSYLPWLAKVYTRHAG